MTGFITKKHLITCSMTIWKMGGLRLWVAVATAPKGSTFLAVYMNHLNKGK